MCRGSRWHVLVNLMLLGALLAMLWWLRDLGSSLPAAPPAADEPLDFEAVVVDFEVILARFDQVKPFASRREVINLLGKPSVQRFPEPRFARWIVHVENGGRNRVPPGRVWEKWIDPNDEQRWVAIFFAGDEVYFRGRAPDE